MGIACPRCFANWGFRCVVAQHADLPDAACPRCAEVGPLISGEQLTQAIHAFFVGGSYIAETMSPVYQVNKYNPDPAQFDFTLDADAKLACALTGEVIFDYGPPLWRVGEVDLKHVFDAGGDRREMASYDFVARGPKVTLPIGTQLFRVRKNPRSDETIATAAAFDPPPAHIERPPGRWDDGVTPVLYASDDLELCIHECRVLLADETVVATLSTVRPLALLDLTAEFTAAGVTPFEDPGIFAEFLSRSRHTRWLDHARSVARAAQAAGLDGIRYTSYYAQAKHKSRALNVALFGRPIDAGDLKIISVNRIRLTDAQYRYSFGPVLYHDSKMQAQLEELLASVGVNLAARLPAPDKPTEPSGGA